MIDLLKKLVEEGGIDVNAKDDRGMPPIIWAIRCFIQSRGGIKHGLGIVVSMH